MKLLGDNKMYDKSLNTPCTKKTLALFKGIQGYYGLNKQESFEKMVEELAKKYNITTTQK